MAFQILPTRTKPLSIQHFDQRPQFSNPRLETLSRFSCSHRKWRWHPVQKPPRQTLLPTLDGFPHRGCGGGEGVGASSKPVEAWECARSAPTSAKLLFQSLPFLTFRFVIVLSTELTNLIWEICRTNRWERLERARGLQWPWKMIIWGHRSQDLKKRTHSATTSVSDAKYLDRRTGQTLQKKKSMVLGTRTKSHPMEVRLTLVLLRQHSVLFSWQSPFNLPARRTRVWNTNLCWVEKQEYQMRRPEHFLLFGEKPNCCLLHLQPI